MYNIFIVFAYLICMLINSLWNFYEQPLFFPTPNGRFRLRQINTWKIDEANFPAELLCNWLRNVINSGTIIRG